MIIQSYTPQNSSCLMFCRRFSSTGKGFGHSYCLLSLRFIYLFIYTYDALLSFYWYLLRHAKYQFKKQNSNQVQISYLLHLSWNNEKVNHTWPRRLILCIMFIKVERLHLDYILIVLFHIHCSFVKRPINKYCHCPNTYGPNLWPKINPNLVRVSITNDLLNISWF